MNSLFNDTFDINGEYRFYKIWFLPIYIKVKIRK